MKFVSKLHNHTNPYYYTAGILAPHACGERHLPHTPIQPPKLIYPLHSISLQRTSPAAILPHTALCTEYETAWAMCKRNILACLPPTPSPGDGSQQRQRQHLIPCHYASLPTRALRARFRGTKRDTPQRNNPQRHHPRPILPLLRRRKIPQHTLRLTAPRPPPSRTIHTFKEVLRPSKRQHLRPRMPQRAEPRVSQRRLPQFEYMASHTRNPAWRK